MALLGGHVGHRRAHSEIALYVCVVCASARGVGVDRRRACPHRLDVGPWYTAGVNGGATLLETMGPARLCVSIAVVGPTLVTPDGRGGLGG